MRLGLHLLLNGNVSKVLTCEELYPIMPELARAIGMTPYKEPLIFDFAGGPSAIQFIMESHISLHYIRKHIAIDVFSCKDFDPEAIAKKLIEIFYIIEVTYHNVIERGFI